MAFKFLFIGGVVSMFVCWLLMPLVIRLAARIGAFSEVGGRHVGVIPVGRLGGISVLTGFFIGLAVIMVSDAAFKSEFLLNWRHLVGLFLGLMVVGSIGVWDDINRLGPARKLIAQIVGAFCVYAGGLKISVIDFPLLEPIQLGWLSLPITLLWIIGIVNAVNLIDGLDGLAGGVMLFASIVNLFAAWSVGSGITAALMAALAGGLLGFLMYNWYPARIYLGDGGAYSAGFLLSTCGLLAPAQKATTGIALLIPLLSLGLPVFDTLLTMFRRMLNHRGVFSPDRGHLHHILFDSGISHRKVVIGLYMVSVFLGSIALLMVLKRYRIIGYFLLIASSVGVLVWGLLVKSYLNNITLNFKKNFNPSRTNEKT